MLNKAPIIEVKASVANVKSWGVADHCTLRPGYRLLFKKATRGDLLLIRPKRAGGIKLGRYFGSTLLSEPHGKPMSQNRWEIHAGVFAIETALNGGAVSSGLSAIKVFNASTQLTRHIESLSLIDEIYLVDLLARIERESPQASVIIASNSLQLASCRQSPPPGRIWVLPKQERYDASSSAWLAPVRRERKRAASKLLQPRHKEYCQMHLPGIQTVCSHHSLASK